LTNPSPTPKEWCQRCHLLPLMCPDPLALPQPLLLDCPLEKGNSMCKPFLPNALHEDKGPEDKFSQPEVFSSKAPLSPLLCCYTDETNCSKLIFPTSSPIPPSHTLNHVCDNAALTTTSYTPNLVWTMNALHDPFP